MRDRDCVELLQWALPRLGMRWPGFRKVRRQVCKRVDRRIAELGLDSVAEYRRHLEREPGEWERLDGLCRITITRFRRDRRVWDQLVGEVMPVLARRARARGDACLRVWSAGCASGEEPYTLSLLWGMRGEEPGLRVLATDADPVVLERARRGCYPRGALRELTPEQLAEGVVARGEELCLRDRHRAAVELERHDVREAPPEGPFDLVLCRNLVLTYFDQATQREVLSAVVAVMREGGALVVGGSEKPPEGVPGLAPWEGVRAVYARKAVIPPRPGRG